MMDTLLLTTYDNDIRLRRFPVVRFVTLYPADYLSEKRAFFHFIFSVHNNLNHEIPTGIIYC
jgi:hypothetical protein